MSRIVYCLTDEAARLATASLLPVLERFAGVFDIRIAPIDVSLAKRILAAFPERLPAKSEVADALRDIERLTIRPDTVLVKPPSISASIDQLRSAIAELNAQGYGLPEYPDDTDEPQQRRLRARYDAIRGSVVNAALRQGTSVRCVPAVVKRHLRSRNAGCESDVAFSTQSCVESMRDGDFLSTEQALTADADTALRIEHIADSGHTVLLATDVRVGDGDVLDAAVMRRQALSDFLSGRLDACRRDGLLFSLPLKCTSMRVSDPAIFATAVGLRYDDAIARHAEFLRARGYREAHGFEGLQAIAASDADRAGLAADLSSSLSRGPILAMVDPTSGRSTLHAQGGKSVAAQMTAAMLAQGRSMGPDAAYADTRFVMPNRGDSDFYRALMEDIRLHGVPDRSRIGSAIVVGLTADAADEYGAQETTFEIERAGRVRVIDNAGRVFFEHRVAAGDIWRACLRSKRAIRQWISCALSAEPQGGVDRIFWLDPRRPRDRETLAYLRSECPERAWRSHGVRVLGNEPATAAAMEALRRGETVVLATGNSMRDQLGDFFGAIEAGTNAVLSVRSELIAGGRVFEAGAAGCAPAVARDFVRTNHLRWNPLGEMYAWRGALAEIARIAERRSVGELADGLERTMARILEEGSLPSKDAECGDLRSFSARMARIWAEEMRGSPEVGPTFATTARRLSRESARIEDEIMRARRLPVELGGYYHPDSEKLASIMAPSRTFNRILRELR